MKYSISSRILIVFIGSFVLTIIPIPELLQGLRPPFCLLSLLYIQLYFPRYFGLTITILIGLCLDALMSTILGEHVMALVLTTWIASTRVRRFPMFALPQQLVLIATLCVFYRLTLYVMDCYQGFYSSMAMVVGSSVSGVMIWPWISMFFHYYFQTPVRSRHSYV